MNDYTNFPQFLKFNVLTAMFLKVRAFWAMWAVSLGEYFPMFRATVVPSSSWSSTPRIILLRNTQAVQVTPKPWGSPTEMGMILAGETGV
jgi:hypothetical protein